MYFDTIQICFKIQTNAWGLCNCMIFRDFKHILSRNKNGNSGDMVFSNTDQFWWNGCYSNDISKL